jgi:protein required for attachment to host cells
MANIWVLVSNSATAKIYLVKNNQDLIEIEHLQHPESRLKASELVSDRQGRGHESNTQARYAYDPTTTVKEVEYAQFAKDLSAHLNAAHVAGKFDKLYIAAGPHFLGLLREAISPGIIRVLAGEITKDITHLDPKKVREYLPEVI